MRIGVIGYGVVGQATARTLRAIGHDVFVQDVMPQRVAAGASEGFGRLSGEKDIDVDFVCVPEGNLSEALADLPVEPFAVIRSTVPPGTTDQLAARFCRPVG